MSAQIATLPPSPLTRYEEVHFGIRKVRLSRRDTIGENRSPESTHVIRAVHRRPPMEGDQERVYPNPFAQA